MSREKIQKLEVDERRAENVNSNDQPDIFKLNDICLIHIFSFLPIPERIRIQRVCKRWQEASALSWCDIKKLEIGNRYDGFFNKSIKCDKIDIPIIRQVLRLCGPCLTHIKLDSIDGRSEHYVLNNKKLLGLVKELCPNLKSIDFCFSVCRRTMRYIADNFVNLRQCTIRHVYTYLEDCLSIFLLKNKNLESLRLISCNTVKGSCMDNLSAETIKLIAIIDCNQFLPENLSQVLEHVHGLETLKIERSKKITANMDMILRLAPEQPNLKTFKIRSEYSQYGSSRKVVNISYMHKFTNLQTLELRGGDVLHDETLVNVGQYCKNLQRAILQGSRRVRNSGLEHITRLPKLDYLELNNIPWATKKIVPHLLELRSFKCTECERLDERSFRTLIEMSKNLEYLEVDRWSYLKALSVKYEIKRVRVSSKPLKLCVEGKTIEF